MAFCGADVTASIPYREGSFPVLLSKKRPLDGNPTEWVFKSPICLHYVMNAYLLRATAWQPKGFWGPFWVKKGERVMWWVRDRVVASLMIYF